MVVQVFLEGTQRADGWVSTTLSSSAVVFVSQYCGSVDLQFVFVKDADETNENVVNLSEDVLEKLNFSFIEAEELPVLVRNVQLPVIFCPQEALVRSGLCCVTRHIVKLADAADPAKNFKDLLGFRQGSLRMCAEVSGWTKLCEVELNNKLTELIGQIKSGNEGGLAHDIELPKDLMKLEAHFLKPPTIHNDDKLRRAVLKEVQEEFEDPGLRNCILQKCLRKRNTFTYIKDKYYPHGNRRFVISRRLDKESGKTAESSECDTGACSLDHGQGEDNTGLIHAFRSLVYTDVDMEHLYSEGLEMTVADLILFVYMYHVLESMNFKSSELPMKIPLIMKWLGYMVSVERICKMVDTSCFKMDKLRNCLDHKDHPHFTFIVPSMEEYDDDDMELSRRCRSKHKAYKPDVSEALKKIRSSKIMPSVGLHPRGNQVQLEWNHFPSAVHPKEGNVPVKRMERKCQQLENLVTAVESVAQPGDVIVDFCSGGGHLGIAIAYLLPECKIFLIENKEESLMKAKHRVDGLNLKNVVFYQCNLGYFHGKFDIGVCLHACGSATDMVLQQCLNNSSSFVICPCCYGNIQKTHLLTYPRSRQFLDSDISYKDFLTLGHAADQTEFNIALEEQGRYCSNLVDTDRAELAREQGYDVTLCSLHPLTCTPKNNLLIGTPKHRGQGAS